MPPGTPERPPGEDGAGAPGLARCLPAAAAGCGFPVMRGLWVTSSRESSLLLNRLTEETGCSGKPEPLSPGRVPLTSRVGGFLVEWVRMAGPDRRCWKDRKTILPASGHI